MVEKREINEKLIKEVKKIYEWLDSQAADKLTEKCGVCGKCCDFIAFDHRLYVTIPEIIYLKAGLKTDALKSMQTGRCPYNVEGKCTVYEYRFSGCRIFNCKADENIQSDLSENVLKKIKILCTEFDVPYRYMDLSAALAYEINSF